ncbi:MAG TPA: sugar phosphate isomerase/epimerase, partial [Planctomycetaceae bacterium]|nr:sugar phosphate isomerase/epimerase [Planctomycetaceae bacterium]
MRRRAPAGAARERPARSVSPGRRPPRRPRRRWPPPSSLRKGTARRKACCTPREVPPQYGHVAGKSMSEGGGWMTSLLSRRQILSRPAVGLGAALSAAAGAAGSEAAARKTEPFGYCLNMGTLLGHKLSVVEQVSVAAQAGWRAVELWMRDLRRYVEGGGSLRDLKAEIAERGLEVASAIGFPRWAVDDDAERAKGLEQLRRDMELVAAIGGRRIAAPPAGIHRTSGVDLRRVAERYRTVLELGRQLGVVPQLEIWGAALTLGTAAEAAFVALAADDPDACLLLDVFHLYKG